MGSHEIHSSYGESGRNTAFTSSCRDGIQPEITSIVFSGDDGGGEAKEPRRQEPLPANVADKGRQTTAIQTITGLRGYHAFNRERFVNVLWDDRVDLHQQEGKVKVDRPQAQFMGFVGTVCSQYGFDSIDGQLMRHSKNGWKKSPADPRHQLATAGYVGGLIEQVNPMKEDLIDQMGGEDEVRYGMYGIRFVVEKGIVQPPREPLELLKQDAIARACNPRIISLPDDELIAKLAALEFSGYDADRMSDGEFESDVLPRVQEIVGTTVDPIHVFGKK